MTEIKTDIQFKKELKLLSGSSLNECMQCGTCTVVCSLTPANKPFPRKEMIWAGWGLKEKLIGNGDAWLCHQCCDCSTYCPRGVKPADVLAAVREINYRYYARPLFLSTMMSKSTWLPLALLIPVVIISAILWMAGTLRIPEGDVNYSAFFPHAWLNGSFTFITFLSYAFWFAGLKKFSNDLQSKYKLVPDRQSFLKRIKDLKLRILSHSDFSKCSGKKERKYAHILVFYGFILLLLVTAFAIFASVTGNYPLKFTNPFKILGNIAGLMLILGLGIMMYNRLFNKDDYGSSGYSDWLFLISLFLLTVSGIVVELARFQNWYYAYHTYFFHLVCVWFVIIYLPYTKFGHFMYRIIALDYTGRVNRE